jgi:hypothetical protein
MAILLSDLNLATIGPEAMERISRQTMPACGSCKYWSKGTIQNQKGFPIGNCKKIHWQDIKDGTLAACESPGELETRSDFGCTMWETKS